MKRIRRTAAALLFCVCAFTTHGAWAQRADEDAKASPWGMGAPSGDALLPASGAKWVRAFEEWQTVEPQPGQWNWSQTDKMVAEARANHIQMLGFWWYFAPWASADGGGRRGPIKNIQYWRDYVAGTVTRYHGDIKYWEIWNEFNGGFYEGDHKVQDYADLVVAAYDAAKKVDPSVKVGLSVASSDVGFLDLVIKEGAANHFDFICIHPYESMSTMINGDEAGFLTLGDSVRQMLASNHQRVDTPLWITEVGAETPVKTDAKAESLQASMLVKAYVLPMAQGFQRIFWFCFRSWTDEGGDFGLLRPDGTKRPSYSAYKTMVELLGPEPKYEGWVDLGQEGHGFLFRGQGGDILAAWALPGAEAKVDLKSDVRVVDLSGAESTLHAGKSLELSETPVFLTHLPPSLAQAARANQRKPFPWGGDYADAHAIRCRMGATNQDQGLRQVFLQEAQKNLTVPVTVDGESVRKVVGTDHDNAAAYFRADSRFIPFGTRALDITAVARRESPDREANLSITYETLAGYKDFHGGFENWSIPAGDGWQEHTWHVTDASFGNKWGWHLGLLSPGGTNHLLIKEVRITKPVD